MPGNCVRHSHEETNLPPMKLQCFSVWMMVERVNRQRNSRSPPVSGNERPRELLVVDFRDLQPPVHTRVSEIFCALRNWTWGAYEFQKQLRGVSSLSRIERHHPNEKARWFFRFLLSLGFFSHVDFCGSHHSRHLCHSLCIDQEKWQIQCSMTTTISTLLNYWLRSRVPQFDFTVSTNWNVVILQNSQFSNLKRFRHFGIWSVLHSKIRRRQSHFYMTF